MKPAGLQRTVVIESPLQSYSSFQHSLLTMLAYLAQVQCLA